MSRLELLGSLVGASPKRRRLIVALSLYVLALGVFMLTASRQVLTTHTSYNHFALLAKGWLEGRLSLDGAPPAYAHGNDFANYEGHWYVAFPPFPAVVLLPFVAIASDVESVRDGQVFLWFSALAPVLIYLLLERIAELGFSTRSWLQNAALGLLACFGTVFYFSAVQGTVWYAAHVIGVCLAASYALCALGARAPLWAGLWLGLGSLTRTPLLFAVPLFVMESLRVSLGDASFEAPHAVLGGLRAFASRIDYRRLLVRWALFALPVAACLGFTFWYNHARFDDPFENGYRFLTVAWQGRMEKWGLFDYHYLSRNLGVLLSMLPWSGGDAAPFRINVHGLALWFTSPIYLWLLWPKLELAPDAPEAPLFDRRWLHVGLWLTVATVALPTLFYQNTGWSQFGYRFSNDYVVFLFALLASGGRRLGRWFWLVAALGVAINAFGAFTFDRPRYQRFYYVDPSQAKFYERD
ncbi:MAG TPA: hypothetical protein VHM70_04090 [Polyangiaceae bacterium]|nr:hypothetical protein [Polyangiaceae bacterium]